MSGRTLSLLFSSVLLAALGWRLFAGERELRSSRLVRAIEVTSPKAAAAGAAGARLLRLNLTLALDATKLDPASVAAAQALGSVYLLLGRTDDAAAAYLRALALQPAPEIYMNLGHAYHVAGADDQARVEYARAVALDARLRTQVPAGIL